MLALPGGVDIKQLNFPDDVIGDPDRVIDEIAAGFDMSSAMLRGNAAIPGGGPEAASSAFLRSIHADLKRDEEFLNQRWLPLFGIEGDACLVYDSPIPEDEQFQLEASTRRSASAITLINEEREMLGLDPVEGGDVPRFNGTPLDKLGQDPLAGLFGGMGRPDAGNDEDEDEEKEGLEEANAEMRSVIARLAVALEASNGQVAKALKKLAKAQKAAQPGSVVATSDGATLVETPIADKEGEAADGADK